MSSCFGTRKSDGADTDPLLPQYEDDTVMQRRLRARLHSYLMVRALTQGFMPTTDQLIINLRTVLASDVLNPKNPGLSESGRLLAKYSKQLLTDFIELLRHKNDGDQIQDFIWYLTKSRVTVDTERLAEAAQSARAKADTSAGISLSFYLAGAVVAGIGSLADPGCTCSLRELQDHREPTRHQLRLSALPRRLERRGPSGLFRYRLYLLERRQGCRQRGGPVPGGGGASQTS